MYLLAGKLSKKVLASVMDDIIDRRMGYILLHVIIEKIVANFRS